MTTEYEAITEREWKDLATTEITHLTDEEKDYLPAAWDAWLAAHDARVRRDAAREALDGLAEHANRTANESRSPQAVNRWDDIWRETRKYRDTHYPEETP